MIGEWEGSGQKTGKQRPQDPRAQEKKAAEGRSGKNGAPAGTPNVGDSSWNQDARCCQGDRSYASPLGAWTQFCKADPRIALGKYSPLEKEILRLGGVHTIASRRLLTHKQEEEQKMLKELQLLSSDYRQVMEYRKQHSSARSTCRPTEKLWTAKVAVPAEEFRMPRRERLDISKHIERMQFARALRSHPHLPSIGAARNASVLSREDLGPGTRGNGGLDEDEDDDNGDAARAQDERGSKAPKRQEIKMNVMFKSEEPKKCLTYQPGDLKPFFPTKRAERSITGLTNRNLFHVSEFPGDLMLMSQEFISRGVHPGDVAKATGLEGLNVWKEYMVKPASHHY